MPEDKKESAKQYQAHARIWFKSVAGGRELAAKLHPLGLWGAFFPRLRPFLVSVIQAAR